MEGTGDFVDVFRLEAAGAAEFFSEDLIDGSQRLSFGLSQEALPFTGNCFAFVPVRIFAELAYGFLQRAVFVAPEKSQP